MRGMADARQAQLSDFLGLWQVRREIRDADGSGARFSGTACWEMTGARALCSETGELQIGAGPSVRAERRYFWDQDLNVYFDDGRFFHEVPPRGGDVAHDCPPDTYRGRYDFSAWPAFELTWTVTGPRKDYRSVTRFFR